MFPPQSVNVTHLFDGLETPTSDIRLSGVNVSVPRRRLQPHVQNEPKTQVASQISDWGHDVVPPTWDNVVSHRQLMREEHAHHETR
jgi:hypothetical protein